MFLLCPSCCTRRSKTARMYRRVDGRIKRSSDIVQLMRNDAKIKILVELLLTKPQRLLLKRHPQLHVSGCLDNFKERGEPDSELNSGEQPSEVDLNLETVRKDLVGELDFDMKLSEMQSRLWDQIIE